MEPLRRNSVTLAVLVGGILALPGCAVLEHTFRGMGGAEGGGASDEAPWRGGEPAKERRVKVVKKTLSNGIQVILHETHAAPVVAFQVWVKVGSADETDEEAGLAHLHEHMLFKGTSRRGVGELAREVEAAGGEINAWTSFDQTVYHVVIASRFFDRGLDVLADAITDPAFDPEELAKEREVILEEIKRLKDIPARVASQNLFGVAYRFHPYRRPVIGTFETVGSFTRDDVLAFYRKWYVPDRMVVVVVGDFEPDVALDRLEKAFGGFRRPSGPLPSRTVEPAQERFRAVVERDRVNEAHLAMSFHIPGILDGDIPALDALSVVLGQGESSRLVREVRRNRQLVTEAYSYAYTPKDPGLLLVGASAPPEKVEAACAALLEEVFRLRYQPVSFEELAKAKAMLESDAIYQKETVQGMARKLGFYETVAGDTAFEETYYAAVARLTVDDLLRVARKYLTVENLSVSLLAPAEAAPEADTPRLETLARNVEASVRERHARVDVQAAPEDVVHMTLDNGVRLIVSPDHNVPVVAMRAVFLGGSRIESRRDEGISNFVAELLDKGTSTRSAEEIAREADSMAGTLEGFAGRNAVGLRAEFLSRHFSRGLDLFADCLLNAAFRPEEVEKSRTHILEEIQAQEDNLSTVAFRLFARTLYGDHPYGFGPLGTAESVGALDRDALLAYYHRVFRPDNMTLAIVGDVDPTWAIREVRRTFGGGGPAPGRAPLARHAWPRPERPRVAFRYRDRHQAHLVLGFGGTTLDDEDRHALDVLSTILSGQGGRLFVELRDRRSLAYSVASFSLEGLDPGHFAVYMGTSPEKLDDALRGILDELRKVVEQPVSPEELERARQYLIGAQAVGLQKASARAAVMASNEAYGLGWDEYRRYPERIAAVTVERVQEVAARYLTLGAYTLAVVKPEDAPMSLSPDIVER